jgi:hypothetical protein
MGNPRCGRGHAPAGSTIAHARRHRPDREPRAFLVRRPPRPRLPRRDRAGHARRARGLPGAVPARRRDAPLARGRAACVACSRRSSPRRSGSVRPRRRDRGEFAYPLGNRDAAYVCGMRQLKLYHAWHDAGLIALPNREPAETPASPPPLRAGVLVENADPITGPRRPRLWVDGGVVAIGLAWATRGHYASRQRRPLRGPGHRAHRRGAGARRGAWTSWARPRREPSQRPIPRRSVRRDRPRASSPRTPTAGPSWTAARTSGTSPTTRSARSSGATGHRAQPLQLVPRRGRAGNPGGRHRRLRRHIEHICDVAGDRTHVGMGSDMDGGFTAARLPAGIDRPGDMGRIADALRDKGWGDAEIAGSAKGTGAACSISEAARNAGRREGVPVTRPGLHTPHQANAVTPSRPASAVGAPAGARRARGTGAGTARGGGPPCRSP